jgi:hypothetical protein
MGQVNRKKSFRHGLTLMDADTKRISAAFWWGEATDEPFFLMKARLAGTLAPPNPDLGEPTKPARGAGVRLLRRLTVAVSRRFNTILGSKILGFMG